MVTTKGTFISRVMSIFSYFISSWQTFLEHFPNEMLNLNGEVSFPKCLSINHIAIDRFIQDSPISTFYIEKSITRWFPSNNVPN